MGRSKRFGWLLGVVVLCLSTSYSHAVEVKGLYDAQVLVEDRQSSAFRKATYSALSEVIVRVSGSSRALESSEVMSALSAPDRYLLQFSYEKFLPVHSVDRAETSLSHTGAQVDDSASESDGEPALMLKMQFDDAAINQLLRRAGLPIWASNRPEVLLWLGAEVDGERQMVSSATAEHLNAILTKESQRRGLPLSMPIYDLQDQTTVSIGDVWGMFTDRIMEASARYPATGVLMAKLYENRDKQWVGNWALRVNGKKVWLDDQGASPEEVVARAVDWAADQLSSQFAILASADDSDIVTLKVTGVSHLAAYARISKYLEGLVAIRQVQVQSVQADVFTFQVHLESDKEQLQQSLKLDGHMDLLEGTTIVPVSQPIVMGPPVKRLPILHYHWKG